MKILNKKSPCLGICVTNSQNICTGCLRSTEEIALWKALDDDKKQVLWERVRERRRNLRGSWIVKDQLRREVKINYPIKKIICLDDSLSQSLYSLGLKNHLLEPTGQDLMEFIYQSNPDLVIADKKTIDPSMIKNLEKNFSLWMSNMINLASRVRALEILMDILPCPPHSPHVK